jgi:hypothetical protein
MQHRVDGTGNDMLASGIANNEYGEKQHKELWCVA